MSAAKSCKLLAQAKNLGFRLFAPARLVLAPLRLFLGTPSHLVEHLLEPANELVALEEKRRPSEESKPIFLDLDVESEHA